MYAAFNPRDIDTVLEQLTAEVDWPNAWEGGRVHGREDVRDYWIWQWSVIDPRVEPASVDSRSDGIVSVQADQVVRAPDGAVVAEGRLVHHFAFSDGLIARMDIEQPPGE